MNKRKIIIVCLTLISLLTVPCFARACSVCGSDNTSYYTERPSCQIDGFTEFECYDCGYSYFNDRPATGHNWTVISSTEPTYSTSGIKYLSCSSCGINKTETIPALVCPTHQYSEIDRVEPTLNNSGTITYQCTICGHTYYSEIDAINPVPPDTSSLAKTVFNGVWGLTDIYVPGFNFTIRQMWLGVVICSISVMIIKHLFNLGGSGVSSRTGSTNKPKVSDERKRDEY